MIILIDGKLIMGTPEEVKRLLEIERQELTSSEKPRTEGRGESK